MAINCMKTDNATADDSNDSRSMLKTPENPLATAVLNYHEEISGINNVNNIENFTPLSPFVHITCSNQALNRNEDAEFHRDEWQVNDPNSNKKRPPRQNEFLGKLLENSRYSSYITWIDRSQGLFRIIRPDSVAELWGKVKIRHTHGKMDYDTFARGIRYYYKKGLMRKTYKKYTFCFNYSAK